LLDEVDRAAADLAQESDNGLISSFVDSNGGGYNSRTTVLPAGLEWNNDSIVGVDSVNFYDLETRTIAGA
jgi:hypothetical protein